MPISSLYLSTSSLSNPPYDKSNLANCKWNIDFDNIFGEATGNCLLTCKFISHEVLYLPITDPFDWSKGFGSINCNFASNNSNNNNGVVIGYLNFDTQLSNNHAYMKFNELEKNGVCIEIPKGQKSLNIQLLRDTGKFLTPLDLVDYQIFMMFEYE